MRSDSTFGIWGKHPEVHSTPEIVNTRCNGCEQLSCIEQERSRLHHWRYYCNRLHRTIDYTEIFKISKAECPEHRDLRRVRF